MFGEKQVEHLGHVISGGGISPRPGLLQAILQVAVPDDRDKLRVFMEMCEYYAKLIKDFGTTAEPLIALFKKNITFSWKSEERLVGKYFRL